jgi:hypothetical protein
MNRTVPLLLAVVSTSLGAAAAQDARDDSPVVAISSKASADYVRPQLPNGKFQAETYAFGKGGIWAGAAKDATIDKVDFMQIARTIAVPLAAQSYVPGGDPKATKLLVMVYWGTTHVSEHATDTAASQNLQISSAAALAANTPQMVRNNPNDSCAPLTMAQASTTGYAIRSPAQIDLDNAMTGAMAAVAAEDRERDVTNARNAAILGYDGAWDEAAGYKGTPLEFRRKELVDEIEGKRYFVVLMAYDFQMMWKEKKAKLLWETRYSIREQGNDFSRQLAAMTREASQYFGRNSGGLLREKVPDGRVDIGQEKILAFGSQN